MFKSRLSWLIVVLGVALSPIGASIALAQTEKSASLPAGTTSCAFNALANDPSPEGLTVRDTPLSTGPILARLPDLEADDFGYTERNKEHAEIEVIGFKDGWFLIDGAQYRQTNAGEPFAGRGWVDSKLVTTSLYRDTLKDGPSSTASDIVYLYGFSADGAAYSPFGIETRIVGCSGPWLRVEIALPEARNLAGKPVALRNGTIAGWTDRSCTEQREGPCRDKQFDYPWSPLPAGVTECHFGAIINDPDPKGLNARAAPSINAPVLGRLAPPSFLDQSTRVRSIVMVIGYKNGWFLVETGRGNDTFSPDSQSNHYTGRGWVAGSMLTAELLHGTLKRAPDGTSADVVNLNVERDGSVLSDPQSVKMRRILACSGNWIHVELALTTGMKAALKTDAPPGAVRGWTDGTCTAELTTCDFNSDTVWSAPAPAPPE